MPDIESAEVRRGAQMVPKGQSEVAVPLRAKGKGVTDVVLSVGKRVQRRTVAVGEAPAGARDSFLVPEVGFRILRVPMLANATIERHWSGLRPGSPTGVPFIGSHPKMEGLFINAGHYRNGVVMAPASAELMTDILLKRPTTVVDPKPYSLDGRLSAA